MSLSRCTRSEKRARSRSLFGTCLRSGEAVVRPPLRWNGAAFLPIPFVGGAAVPPSSLVGGAVFLLLISGRAAVPWIGLPCWRRASPTSSGRRRMPLFVTCEMTLNISNQMEVN